MPNTMKTVLFSLLPLSVLVQSQADPMVVEGCSGTDFTGTCEIFECPYQDCCTLPPFFQDSLVSVRSKGSYNFNLFTAEGCSMHCSGLETSRPVDAEGWSNIGADAYACVDGPY